MADVRRSDWLIRQDAGQLRGKFSIDTHNFLHATTEAELFLNRLPTGCSQTVSETFRLNTSSHGIGESFDTVGPDDQPVQFIMDQSRNAVASSCHNWTL